MDEDYVFVSIPNFVAELVFERVEADIDNEEEVFIHKDSESAGNSSDAESHESLSESKSLSTATSAPSSCISLALQIHLYTLITP